MKQQEASGWRRSESDLLLTYRLYACIIHTYSLYLIFNRGKICHYKEEPWS
jgi:hypothetical protein